MSCCRSFGIFFVTIEENEHELPKNTHFRRRKFHRTRRKRPQFHRNRRKSPSVTFWTKQDFFESMAPATAENFIVSVEKIRGEPFITLLRRTESKFASAQEALNNVSRERWKAATGRVGVPTAWMRLSTPLQKQTEEGVRAPAVDLLRAAGPDDEPQPVAREGSRWTTGSLFRSHHLPTP